MDEKISNKYLVSVIIPTYNRSKYLKIAIESVLEQTHTNFELLILDNCSNDNTREVISKYSDIRIKSITHLANIGPFANWLYGMHWSKGQFFTILGDDDFYRPNFLEVRIDAFDKFKNAVAVFSDHDECDEHGTIIVSSRKLQYKYPQELSGNDLLDTIDNSNRTWIIGSGLYKRNPVVAWWDECIYAGKAFDTAIQVKIACKSSAVIIPDKGLIYRRHSHQDSIIGGLKNILIGHVNAYLEPLLFEFGFYQFLPLRKGALWALYILANSAQIDGDKAQAKRILKLIYLVDGGTLEYWLLFLKIKAPYFVYFTMRLIKALKNIHFVT